MSGTQMRLRYNGVCRLCAVPIAAGTVAVYERPTRTVRCLECSPAQSLPAATTTPAPLPASAETPPTTAETEDLRLRPPAASVISETLREQSTAPPRSRLARVFGKSPLTEQSLPWYLGAIGELEVARALDQLGSDWQVVHAVPIGAAGSDIDHVVVGPAGIFTINTKYHEGQRVWVGSRRVLVGGHATDHLRNSRYEAARVAKILARVLRDPVAVRPIIVIVAARQIMFKEQPIDVAVLRSTELVRWLNHQPASLSVEQIDQLARTIRGPRTWGVPVPAEPDLALFSELRETVASARRTRRAWALALIALPLIALAGLVQFAQAVLTWL